MKLKRPLRGSERGTDVRMVQRALNRWTAGVPIPVTGVYDETTEVRMVAFQREEKISPASGKMGQPTLDALWPYFDAYGRMRYRNFRVPKPLPRLGPVFKGGRSMLDQDLTHSTSGIDLYPAFDDAFRPGLEIIAPEPLVVTKNSSSRPGDAFYATGDSGIRYWFGHLVSAPAVGRRFRKGQTLGVVLDHSIGGGPHVHVGINVEQLLGADKELQHRIDYRHGAPTVREQLMKVLA